MYKFLEKYIPENICTVAMACGTMQRVQPQTLYMKNVDDMKKSLAFYKHIE